MARTTAIEVKKVIEVDEVSWPDLDPFINAANELVTECCGDAGYAVARLMMIETWLAAHFYAIADARPASEKAGSVGVSFMYKVDLNLAVTTYGQQAMLLDTAGGLAALNLQATSGKGQVASVNWLGKDKTEAEAERDS